MKNYVTVVIIHYNTPELLSETISSFRVYYPDVPMLVIDNGSDETHVQQLELLQQTYSTEVIYLPENIYHGPAMDYAVDKVKTPYIFFLDSDTRTEHGAFLEKMVSELDQDGNNYGIGKRKKINTRGFTDKNGFYALSTPFMMIAKKHYNSLPAFIHHGIPTVRNFKQATEMGLNLLHFPIEDYIYHKGRGTAEKFGYGLGLRGKLDFILNKMGI